jgi:thiosulfate dehydrogenase [quinone] large subunit
MNWNYIMAGSASTNALLLAIAVGLVAGWKVAGWIGLDRWLLPLLGTPWRPGTLFTGRASPTSPAVPADRRGDLQATRR